MAFLLLHVTHQAGQYIFKKDDERDRNVLILYKLTTRITPERTPSDGAPSDSKSGRIAAACFKKAVRLEQHIFPKRLFPLVYNDTWLLPASYPQSEKWKAVKNTCACGGKII